MKLTVEIPDESDDGIAMHALTDRLAAWFSAQSTLGDGAVVSFGPPAGPMVFAAIILGLETG